MKQLVLVRHAKSSWADASQEDFDRPLNDRGHKDAVSMAARLVKKNILPDAFITSPAKRALTTCRYFAGAFKFDNNKIIKRPNLYLANIAAFRLEISNLDNKFNTVFIFSHNNGITDFANTLTKTRVDNMPTCGVFAVALKTKDWKSFEQAEKEFLFFHYPKEFS